MMTMVGLAAEELARQFLVLVEVGRTRLAAIGHAVDLGVDARLHPVDQRRQPARRLEAAGAGCGAAMHVYPAALRHRMRDAVLDLEISGMGAARERAATDDRRQHDDGAGEVGRICLGEHLIVPWISLFGWLSRGDWPA
ncbi:MAG: hypothetical protein E5W76_31615 [Mesorhizobium sp.]|nr:MAG: hypothetical protein E5W76_31615 [Mesorhizobium sp.]